MESRIPRLQVVRARAPRRRRTPPTAPGLPRVSAQLAVLQQQFTGQIAALEEGIRQQRLALAGTLNELRALGRKSTG